MKKACKPPLGFLDLDRDAQLLIFDAVESRCDRAALCLAMPTVGLVARRQLPGYRDDPLLSVAVALHGKRVMQVVDEGLLRKYAHRLDATPEGCAGLREVTAKIGWDLHICCCNPLKWYLCYGSLHRVHVRTTHKNGDILCYAGEYAPRLIKWKDADGRVRSYDGVQGKECIILSESVCDEGRKVTHFEGCKGEEHYVRCHYGDKDVDFFEGPRGEERVIRNEWHDGVEFRWSTFEGPRGEERLIRGESHIIGKDVRVGHFEGLRHEEHLVRVVETSGAILHFAGPRDKEYKTKCEHPNGMIEHFEGSTRGKECLIKIKHPNGNVDHHEGPKGAERLFRTDYPDGNVKHFLSNGRVILKTNDHMSMSGGDLTRAQWVENL